MKKILGVLAVLTGSGLLWAGCSQNTAPLLVRSLERSGKSAFLCIRDPTSPSPGQELDACFAVGEPPLPTNYIVPHVIALVTQTARGEVAIVDVTADSVIDVDQSVPGYNFLPVGAMPTDIVSTPGGNAAFVGIGDPTRPGIFAIPSSSLPLWNDGRPQPTLASWPACALPPGGVPTEMLLVPDTTASASDPGGRRAHCDGSPGEALETGRDLSLETQMFGRLKLVVSLPELGEIDVIDAQDLLMRERGAFEPCTVERRIFLTVDASLPPATPTPDAGAGDAGVSDAPEPGDAGASPDGGEIDGAVADTGKDGPGSARDAGTDAPVCTPLGPCSPPNVKPHPYALALSDDGRLFVSDDKASVIHVVDLRDPCTGEEKAPLLPISATDPLRAVVSGAIAVSPLTSSGKRFVYAADVKGNGNLMVFDVSTTSTTRTPLFLREDPRYNPFESPDRIVLAAPVESLTFATHEVPRAKPDETGVIPRGVPCDPANPGDPNRPPEDFVSAGAGPRRLRGTFAFVAMTNGDLTVIDLDDFDTKCRRPRYTDDDALGCSEMPVPPVTGFWTSASQEVSCKVVEPHRVRSMNFFTNSDNGGRHAPAMLTFPILYDKDGTALNSDASRPETKNLPKLLGPRLIDTEHDEASWPLLATVLSSAVSPGAGLFSVPAGHRDAVDGQAPEVNWITFDLHAPRVHSTQVWNVTYEGALPWFAARRGRLQCHDEKKPDFECETGDDASHYDLFDSAVGFCNGGAQGEDMAPAGDILEIIDDMPDPADPYWSTDTVRSVCSRAACEEVFGTLDAPRVLDNGDPVGRDIAIEKSYQGRLTLKKTVAAKDGVPVPITCCFPYPLAYTIRAGKQWIVTGQASGFAHRLIADTSMSNDPIDQACKESDDPNLILRNGRLLARSPADPEPVPSYDDATPEKAGRTKSPGVFYNAQLRFVLWDTEGTTCMNPPCSGRVRDRFFSFQEVGGFIPMRFGLASNQVVMPQSVRYVRGLQMLAIPDAVAQGLILFDLDRLATTISIY
jgi:hypothetical protein